MPKTLLFTGGGGAGSEALYRLLNERYSVHFADADPLAKPPSIPCERWHVIPPANTAQGLTNTAFIPALAEICEALGADVLIPGVDEELRQIAMPAATRRERFACDILLPEYDFVATHLDKLASMARLKALGIPVPETKRLRPRANVIEWPAFPCVVKPREGRGSRGVQIVRSQREGEAHLLLMQGYAADFITQELLIGQEYTVTMVASPTKQLRAMVPVRVDVKRGVTLRAETEYDEAVLDACERIHHVERFAGCVNVQVIKTSSGEVKPFEINPRVSTTLCMAIASGVDPIAFYLGLSPTLEPPLHVTLNRSWQTELRCVS